MNTASAPPAPQNAWPRSTRWPLPALAVWALAWLLYGGLTRMGVPAQAAALGGTAAACGGALCCGGAMRRAITAAGFPLSLWALGAPLPQWAWLLPLVLLAVIYPTSAWRDAPLFPTPGGALDTLAAHVELPAGARVLDAGCGIGDGLRALRRAFPHARIEGIESSGPLVLIGRLRCRFAHVRRADMWQQDWGAYALVYLFQRPETMPRAWAKARAEMRRGAWVASLDFAVPGRRPSAMLTTGGGRRLWLYRVPGRDGSSRPDPGR